jgi:hypothetical protein
MIIRSVKVQPCRIKCFFIVLFLTIRVILGDEENKKRARADKRNEYKRNLRKANREKLQNEQKPPKPEIFDDPPLQVSVFNDSEEEGDIVAGKDGEISLPPTSVPNFALHG